MAIYEKPVRLLMRDMADDFNLEPDQVFTKREAINWFTTNYPKVKEGTITAHLIRLSTNANSRIHYNAKPVEDDLFFQIDGSRFRLYKPNEDPEPIYVEDKTDQEEIIEDKDEGSDEFAYEKDLQNYLSKNLYVIESSLRLYEDDDINGIEFPAGRRFIDILAVDKNNDLVVIELKVSRGYDRVVGQIMRYMSWIKIHQAEEDQNVRGIIIAREISEDLTMACSLLSDVELFEYQLSFSVSQIEKSYGI